MWEKNVPLLQSIEPVKPIATWCPSGSYSHKHGEKHRGMFTTDRAKNRAKTFEGVARAMAEQDEEIKEKVDEVCNYYIDYNVEEGYESYTETRYRKKGSWY